VVDRPEDPQAAIASAHQMLESAITRACRAQDVVSLGASRIVVHRLAGRHLTFLDDG
jgi:hypothetical protein